MCRLSALWCVSFGLLASTMMAANGLCGILGDELSDDDAVRVCFSVIKRCDEPLNYIGYSDEKHESIKNSLKPYISGAYLNTFMAAYKETYRAFFGESVFFWTYDSLKSVNGKHEARRIMRSAGKEKRITVTINDDNVYAGLPFYDYTFTLAAEQSDSILMNYRVWRVIDLEIASGQYSNFRNH